MLLQKTLIMGVNCNRQLVSDIAVNKTELFSAEKINCDIWFTIWYGELKCILLQETAKECRRQCLILDCSSRLCIRPG